MTPETPELRRPQLESPELKRMSRPLAEVDPEIADLLRDEARRQATGLELIPSENLVSEAVLEAMGSIFTNKYAEGYPGKRYYGGCEYVDKVEQLAIDRAKELFGAEHANVQAHSGTPANISVYMAALQPGDTVLGMNLAHGGHLTHGHPLNFSGRMYKFVAYGVRKDDETIDYDEIEAPRARAQPENDRRRRQRLFAHHRFRAHRAKSRAASARYSSWTWRTSPGWSPRACIPARFRTPTSSPPPRTRRCAARAAAWCSAAQKFAKELDSSPFPARKAAR